MLHTLLICLLLTALLVSARIAHKVIIRAYQRPTKVKRFVVGATISFFSLGVTLVLLEAVFHLFVLRTHFFGFTYAAARWWDTYWKPVNRFAYRDFDYTPDELKNKRVVFVIGDSIVAGQGIENIEDRFSDKIGSELGDEWRVLNIAKCGWGTSQELQALEDALKLATPEVIILSYYSNDFEALSGTGFQIKKPTGVFGAIVEVSALINYVYWRIYLLQNRNFGNLYWDNLKIEWSKEEVRSKHLQDLERFAAIAHEHSSKFLVVIMPTLLSLEQDRFVTDEVQARLEALRTLVIDLHAPIAEIPEKYRVVSSFDHHPSKTVNDLTAKLLLEKIRVN